MQENGFIHQSQSVRSDASLEDEMNIAYSPSKAVDPNTRPYMCPQKLSLLKDCAILTRAYARGINSLHKVTSKPISAHAHSRFQQIADEARRQSEMARLAYEKHIAEHGC
jgi:hypothetical protein